MLTPLAACAAALLLASWLLRPVLRQLRLLRKARSFAGPPAWPLVGNLFDLNGDGHHSFKTMVRMLEKFGNGMRVWMGPKLMVVLTDPHDIQRVLGDPEIVNHDLSMTDALTPFIANGLLSARDHHWKVHRKLVAASFTPRQLQRYLSVMGANADILCRKLEALPSATVPDFRKLAGLCTMDSICETAVGVHLSMQSGENLGFYDGIVEGMRLIHNRVVRPWLLIDWLYPWTADGRLAAERKKQIAEFTESVVSYRPGAQAAQPSTRAADDADDVDLGRKPARSLLRVLQDAQARGSCASTLTASDLRDEITTTAAAGFETTAITICNLLLLVGLHPAVQDEIARELELVFDGDLRPATMADIDRMTYLHAVVKETLRLLPVVPTLSREIAADLALPSGRTLPAGCTCVVFSYATHRDARHFRDPESFAPDRWARGEPQPHRYAYLPFGGGHRNCVGDKFAALQIKSIVSSLLRRFRVSHLRTAADLGAQELGISMSMTTPYEITFTSRQLATQRLLDALD